MSDDTPVTGSPFKISERYELTESLRRGDGITRIDQAKMTGMALFVLVGIPAAIAMLVFGVYAGLRGFLLSLLN